MAISIHSQHICGPCPPPSKRPAGAQQLFGRVRNCGPGTNSSGHGLVADRTRGARCTLKKGTRTGRGCGRCPLGEMAEGASGTCMFLPLLTCVRGAPVTRSVTVSGLLGTGEMMALGNDGPGEPWEMQRAGPRELTRAPESTVANTP
eukprot:gene11869-biopygen7893